MLGPVPVDHLGHQRPEPLLGEHAVDGEDAREVPQHAVEHVGEDRERLLGVVDDGPDALDARGQGALAQDRHLLADVLHEHPVDPVVAQHQDQVLPVRHEREVVREQAVHERVEVGVEVGTQPRVRGQTGRAHQGGRERAAGRVAVQQARHGREPLPGRRARQR